MVLTPEQQRRSRMRRMNLLMAYAALSAKSNQFPLSLFSGGEQGAWYDPSDLSTMFQDAAGTIPVTAAGNPVGLVLDKSRGLAVGPELITDPSFDNAGSWNVGAGWSISGGAATVSSAASGAVVQVPAINRIDMSAGEYFLVNIVVDSISAGGFALRAFGSIQGPTLSAAGTYTYFFQAPLTQSAVDVGIRTMGTTTGVISSFSFRRHAGNHATQSTAGSRPILRQDANSRWYLEFDGTDDSLSTGTITPGSVDKAQVFAGVRKLSDAARGIIAEFSDTIDANNGAFNLTAPNAASNTFAFESKGTTLTDAVGSGFSAPLTRVLTGLGDIAGDRTTLRVNGSQADQDTGDQGTGNYGSYALRIGSRGGSSLRFNGWLYGLIIRFSSANLADATIAQAETWMNGKTGAD